MRNLFFAFLAAGLMGMGLSAKAQTVSHQWQFESYAVGMDAAGEAAESSNGASMPEPIQLADGTYRMYYGVSLDPPVAGAMTAIHSATSSDGLTWTVEGGHRLLGDGDGGGPDGIPANEGIINGPAVVRLSDGTYRMYYQASTQGTMPPDFRVKSATSPDGLTWTREEGTRIDINGTGAAEAGKFSLAGQCFVIRFADDDYVVWLSGNYETANTQFSDLVMGTSTDGLTFSNFSVLYTAGHDPYVLSLADGSGYWLFYGDPVADGNEDRQRSAFSTDGKTWPAADQTYETILYDEDGTEVTEDLAEGQPSPGDRGALELSSGEILLFVNWGTPSGNVALMREQAVCGNSRVQGDEGCDDGNTTAGDGCSEACALEEGFTCTGEPSTCTEGGTDGGDGTGSTASSGGCQLLPN